MKRALPILGIAVVVGAAIGIALWAGGGDGHGGQGASPNDASSEPSREAIDTTPASAEARQGASDADPDAATLTTRVYLWRIEGAAAASGGTYAAAGKNAILTGRVVRGEAPVKGVVVKVIGGLDAGAAARTGEDGSYAFAGLYPGLAVLEFEPPGQPKVVRQALLRRATEEALDLDLESWGNVRGTIRGIDGKPVKGARVELDGAVVETDAEGAFQFSGVPPGDCILYMSAPGLEARRAILPLRPRQALESEANGFVLRPSEVLTVSFELLAAEEAPPYVVLLPGEGAHERAFPFEKLGVQQLRPGDNSIRIEGVPIGESFQVRAAGAGGVSNPGMRPVLLKKGDTNLSKASFKFVWKAPLRGRVLSGGKPLAGARVRVESADLARATEDLLRDGPGPPVPAALPPLPFVKRLTKTDSEGAFRIETGDVPPPATLVIEADGHRGRVLSIKSAAADLGAVELQAEPREGPGGLAIEFQRAARRQVQVFADGRPPVSKTLAPGERIDVAKLEPGVYGMRVIEETDEDRFPAHERFDVRIPAVSVVKIPRN